MFKKPVEVKCQQRLSGADRKKLSRTIKERFPNASDADVDSLLPLEGQITVSKHPNRVLVYWVEGGYPMFFDIDGRGTEIFPTVYALWKVLELLPAFVLKGGEVSRFVIGGADLMFPGIQIPMDGLPSFLAGQAWAVKVPAILLLLLERVENPYVPNAGFLEDVVFEDSTQISVCEAADSCEGDTSADQGNAVRNEESDDVVDAKDDQDVTTEVSEQLTSEIRDLNLKETAEVEDSNIEDQHALSVEEVDALLDLCLLQALPTSVKDKDLPLPGSTLWSSNVLPCWPLGVTLDIKNSSYKKLSNWLQAKAFNGLVGYIVTIDSSGGTRMELLRMRDAGVIGVYHPLVDEKLVKVVHGRKNKVFAWTVDEETSMQKMLIERVDTIVTSNPSLLERVMQDMRTQCLKEGFFLSS